MNIISGVTIKLDLEERCINVFVEILLNFTAWPNYYSGILCIIIAAVYIWYTCNTLATCSDTFSISET